jgi:hypothetical protein
VFAGLCTLGLFTVSLDFSGLFLALRLGLRDGRGMMFEVVDVLFYALELIDVRDT